MEEIKSGIYSEYLNKQMSFENLVNERKKQLKIISEIRGRDVLVFASDLGKNGQISIDYSDVLPFSDQLSVLNGAEIDIILETPGGFAEVVEDLVRLVRNKYQKVGIIVPGYAKSAGTIFTMAADEILMGNLSALGPIDAQISNNNKRYSADAFLEGLNKIINKANENNKLEIGYIPILQNISPGEIQHCENAQNFSKILVTKWLKEYKFKFWQVHESSGTPVTPQDKQERANDIAKLLCNHNHWLTHGRSIKMEDLRAMRLKITDYTEHAALNEAITRYYTLLRMSFETNIYKIYETPFSQIYRSINQNPIKPQDIIQNMPNPLTVNLVCNKCKGESKLQLNLDKIFPQKTDHILFPQNNKFKCPHCGSESDILGLRQQFEAQYKKRIM